MESICKFYHFLVSVKRKRHCILCWPSPLICCVKFHSPAGRCSRTVLFFCRFVQFFGRTTTRSLFQVMVTLKINWQYGNILAWQKWRNWPVIRVEFYTWFWVRMVRLSFQRPQTRLCVYGNALPVTLLRRKNLKASPEKDQILSLIRVSDNLYIFLLCI